jgi:hypothetical protein
MADIVKDSDEYRIVRETRAQSPYEYEFVLYVNTNSSAVDGLEEVITATEVASRGGFGFDDIDNWTGVLTVFAEAYLKTERVEDGLDAVIREYEL